LKDNASEILYILFKYLMALMSFINIPEENQLHYVYDKSLNSVFFLSKRTGELFLQRLLRPWLWNDLLYSQTKNGKLFYKNMDILHSFTDKVK
jgi:hypothetical protein